MRNLCVILVLGCLGCVAQAQTDSPAVKLCGIVDPGGNKTAILQVENAKPSDQLLLGEGQTQVGLSVLTIDSKSGTTTISFKGEKQILKLTSTETNRPAISLNNANLKTAVDVYSRYSQKTVLQHPNLPNELFSILADPTNDTEAVGVLEQMFLQKKIAAIPDGEKFVMLVPFALTNTVTPHSSGLPEEYLNAAGSINFINVSLGMVGEVYASYLGRAVANPNDLPCCQLVNLYQQNPLSKDEITYAFETLFAWGGYRLVPVDAKTSRWEPIPKGK